MKYLTLCLALLAVGVFSAASPVKDSCRERAVNETLTTVLLVGADFRNKGLHPTWDEIANETARRMKVKRLWH